MHRRATSNSQPSATVPEQTAVDPGSHFGQPPAAHNDDSSFTTARRALALESPSPSSSHLNGDESRVAETKQFQKIRLDTTPDEAGDMQLGEAATTSPLVVTQEGGSRREGSACPISSVDFAAEASTPKPTSGLSLVVDDSQDDDLGIIEVDVPAADGFDLEVDEDEVLGDEEGDEADEDGDTDYRGRAKSVFTMSTYPGVQPAFQVEYPFQHNSGRDSATIDSSRTLYADDYDFVTENGRQYCGDYFLPIDQTEQTRQYVIHQVYLRLFDLELTTVPLEDPRYILDIGTGIGEWAIGMAEKYPDAEVFGTDIAPIQPTQQVPFNIEFHIENAEEEWIRPANTVDLVHLRNMAGAFGDWKFIYGQAFECIKPGGWIEVLDYDDMYAYQNFLTFYPEDSPVHHLFKGIYEALDKSGRVRGRDHMREELLIEAGFVDIRDTVYDLGIGSRASSSYGKFWLFAVVTGIEPTALRLLTKYLGWDPDYARDLCEQVAQETKKMAEDPVRAESFVIKLRVLSGRKPDVPGAWTAQVLNETAEMVDLSGADDDSTIGSRSNKTLRSEGTL